MHGRHKWVRYFFKVHIDPAMFIVELSLFNRPFHMRFDFSANAPYISTAIHAFFVQGAPSYAAGLLLRRVLPRWVDPACRAHVERCVKQCRNTLYLGDERECFQISLIYLFNFHQFCAVAFFVRLFPVRYPMDSTRKGLLGVSLIQMPWKYPPPVAMQSALQTHKLRTQGYCEPPRTFKVFIHTCISVTFEIIYTRNIR